MAPRSLSINIFPSLLLPDDRYVDRNNIHINHDLHFHKFLLTCYITYTFILLWGIIKVRYARTLTLGTWFALLIEG